MVLLKNGSEVQDPRLDFLPEKDERSRLYKAVDVIEKPSLRYRDWYPGIWLNQQAEGACVAFALSHELASSPVRYTAGIDDAFAFEVYHEAQHIDSWPGCSRGLQCDIEPARDKYEGTSVLAGTKALANRGIISEYRWAFGEEELALAVASLGPAVIGVPWYNSMYTPDERNFIRPDGQMVGGHAIVVAGIDPYAGHYKLWNSWGKDYGINGWCKITRDDMATLLSQNGEAVIPFNRAEEDV